VKANPIREKTTEKNTGTGAGTELFEVLREANDRAFNKAEESSAQFVESMMALRKEAVNAWRDSVKLSIDLQAELAHSAGLTPKVSSEIKEMIQTGVDAWAAAQNDLENASINAAKQLIQGYGGAAKAAAELGRMALILWFAPF